MQLSNYINIFFIQIFIIIFMATLSFAVFFNIVTNIVRKNIYIQERKICIIGYYFLFFEFLYVFLYFLNEYMKYINDSFEYQILFFIFNTITLFTFYLFVKSARISKEKKYYNVFHNISSLIFILDIQVLYLWGGIYDW